MLKELVLSFGFLVLLVCGMGVHYILFSSPKDQTLQTLSSLTRIYSPSLSVAFYELRLSLYDSLHPSYPSMPSLNKRDFIYEK